MPILRGVRTLNSVQAGTTLAAALETLLADAGRRDDYAATLGVRAYARRAATSALTIAATTGSNRAFESVLTSAVAVDEFASSPPAVTAFQASPALLAKISLNIVSFRRWIRQWPWVRKSAALPGNVADMAYGAGLYVAVGTGGQINTSPDLVTWTARTSNVIQNLKSVCFGGGSFAAVGDQGVVTTSPDGITWTSRTLGLTGTTDRIPTKVAYGNGKWVAMWNRSGTGAFVSYTADITNWSTFATISVAGTSDATFELAFGNGVFVAAGRITNGYVWRSTDGINWTVITPPGGAIGLEMGNVTFDSVLGVFLAKANPSSVLKFYTSTDGLGWTLTSVGTTYTVNTTEKTAAYNGVYFCTFNTGQAAYTDDYVNGTIKACPGLGGLTTPTGFAVVNGNVVHFTASGIYALY